MKNWILGLFSITLFAGCSTTPTAPEPHPEKYAFQVVAIEIPASVQIAAMEFEQIMVHPEAECSEYPIVYAGPGKSVTNDQTKAVAFPEDYNIVDGKAVASEKTCNMGYSTAVEITKVEENFISYHIKTHYQELAGYDTYNLEDGISVKMPFFKSSSINTDLTQKTGSWIMLGGLVGERTDGIKVQQMMGIHLLALGK